MENLEPIRKNRARTFNEILAADYPDLAKRILPAAMPSQAEIDAMVRKAWAEAEPREPISKGLPVLRTLDPVESLIAKADTGEAHPSEIDALIDGHVRKNMIAEDRGSIPLAFSRLATGNDKHLNRLYAARQTAARNFTKGGHLPVARNAADAANLTAEGITERVETMARDLCRLESGLTMEQARARVWTENPELYSAFQAAKAAGAVRKNAVARVTNRVAAEKQAAEIEAEMKARADDLRRRFPGRFSPAQAMSEVLEADKSLYSQWIAAKQKATR
jgi:hypothetical protein